MADCLFCKIAAHELDSTIVHESDRVVAFQDINPGAPTHVLVIPKQHHPTAGALASADPSLLGEVDVAAQAVAEQEGLVDDGGAEPGYRVVANTGSRAGQTVHHVHFHVLGGRDMRWPPG